MRENPKTRDLPATAWSLHRDALAQSACRLEGRTALSNVATLLISRWSGNAWWSAIHTGGGQQLLTTALAETGGAGGAGAPSFSISEASVGDAADVLARGQSGTLAERKYDSIFVHSGKVDDFTVTLAPGYVLRLRIWGSAMCSVPDLADAASTQSD